MTCGACGRANRAGARFCGGCGKPLAPRCLACGAENEPHAQFCDACGVALGERPTDRIEARKVVTIVFADLIGSTSLHERLDAESVRRLMDRYYRALHGAVDTHGGTVVKLLGDGVMAAFGVPRVAEDDAVRAVRAGVSMQRAFRDLVHEQTGLVGDIGLRVAVNTGEVVVSDDHADVVGDPVNVAARLQQEAHDGDVLIGESTRRLVSELVTLAPFGALALKGRLEKVAAYRVVSLDRPAGAPAMPFVGREDELRRLMAVYDAAVAARAARLAVVLGSPGLGKSRLLAEFARRLGDGVTVLTARCDAAGGATFAPLAEALRVFFLLDDDTGNDALRRAIEAVVPAEDSERTRITNGITELLAGTPAPPEETFFIVRRLLGALAAPQPVVLAIDDIQWAEPLLLDLTEHLVQWSTDVPLLVLAAARPELRDARSSLTARGGLIADVVTLAGLDAGAATRLAANVIGADELPAALAGRVLATSEGNPLFVGELVRMLVHDGALKREGDRWTTGVALADLEMPPTIHALLAARIERLRPEERMVLERAAVVGRHFSRTAVAYLLPQEITDLDARLESLRRSELIEPDTGWFLGEPSLRFHHMLIRDAAYRRLLKGTRAELHGRFADWLETRVGAAIEHDETIGWHLEQAHQHLRELGPLDGHGHDFGARAARYLTAAGRRALARDDLPLAASLLGRALRQLDATAPTRADLVLDWCEALLAGGDVGPAAAAIDELRRCSSGSDRLRAWHTCFAGQLAVLTAPQTLRATADAVAAAADELEASGDAAGEAKAHSVHALALARLGKIGACEAALDRALAAARRANDRRRANAVLAGAPLAALWGPSPVTRASGRCLDVVRVLRITQGAPAVEAVALRCQGVLEALRGRIDAARRMIASSRRMVEELGITQRLLEADVFAGLVELLDGDAAAAERCLRVAYDGLRSHGLGIDAAQAAALLGRALLAQDRAQEAEALSHDSEALAGDDLKAAIAWRGVRAEALARRGEHVAAADFARAAVDIAAATDALLDHADARSTLASVLHMAGRSEEAATAEAHAIELWEAKGATLLAERARSAASHAPAGAPRRSDDRAPPVRSRLHRVRPNAATANAARLDAMLAARDDGALPTLLAETVEIVHHPTGVVYDREGALAAWHTLLRARDLRFAHEAVATLGDSLALFRTSVSFSALPEADVGPIGAASWDEVILIEVDLRGQRRRAEFFAADKLGMAITRLYERYADLLPDGPTHDQASRTAASAAALLGPPDLTRWSAAIAPAVEYVDHRTIGFPSASGIEGFLRDVHTLFETGADIVARVDDILCLRADALLVRWTILGTERIGGGAYENQCLQLFTCGADGLVTRTEQFDSNQEGDALARLDELAPSAAEGPIAPAARFTNAASQSQVAFERCWRERDWDRLVAMLAPNPELDDRRALVGLRLKGEDFFTNARILFATPSGEWHSELLATRGERLALFRARFTAEIGAGGHMADEHLSLVEHDVDGRRNALVVFDVGDLDAAYEELDARFAAGEGAPYAALLADWRVFRQAANARDWETVRRVLPDDFTMLSHRRLANTGTRLNRDEFIASLSWGDDRGVRSTVRRDHLPRLSARAAVEVVTLHGTLDGGDFEQPFIIVIGYDGTRPRMSEAFDLDQIDKALARYEELSTTPTVAHLENAATRSAARFDDAWAARDWDRVAALFPPSFRNIDRRSLMRLELNRAQYLESLRPFIAMTESRLRSEVLATRGDRLALFRVSFQGTDGTVGPSEVEWLELFEIDEGDLILTIGFNPDDLDVASAELDERYAAIEAASSSRTTLTRAFTRAFAARDWDALATLLTPALVVNDHRLLGWETLRGPAPYIEALKSLVDLAPDVQLRIDHVTMSGLRFLYVTTWVGTHEGGAFESPSVILCELDVAGRIRRFDQYDLNQLDEARACFSELRPDPLHIPPNGATRASDRWQVAFEARDWNALEALYAPTLVLDERRRFSGGNSDRETFVASDRWMASRGTRVARTVLATAGNRLALEHRRWTAAEDAAPFEVESLHVIEVDAEGRLTANIVFDADDRRAASLEGLDRYFRSDEARWTPQSQIDLVRALNDHDLASARAALPDNFYFHDHRRTGMGRIDNVDDYIASLAAVYEQSPDMITDTLYHVAVDKHGSLSVGRMFGTLVDGGPFESVFVRLNLYQGDRGLGAELFEIEDLAVARARFEELRPDPLRIPPNTATRANERSFAAIAARDWPAYRALTSTDFIFDDRRKRSLVSGDVDLWIKNLKVIASWQISRRTIEPIATIGDRIALDRIAFAGDHDGSTFEGEFLRLTEVDANGRLRAVIHFDLDDRRAAFDETQARFTAGEAAAIGGQAPINVLGRAWAQHDWAAVRDLLADGTLVHDRRSLGMGQLEPDEWIESWRIGVDLAPDVRGETIRILAWNHHGRVWVNRVFGTTRDGGAFEHVFIILGLTDGDRIRRYEFFDIGDADQAVARFAELCAELPAATR